MEKQEAYAKDQAIYDGLRLNGHILFETVIGSQAHGTSTPKSDVDTCFVYMAPLEWLYVRSNYREYLRLGKDRVGYELEHFLGLVASNNPTIFELLWTPEDCWILKSLVYDVIQCRRDEFLSKVAKNSYLGYASAQIRKAKGMDKFQNWTKERTVKKNPIDFCWVISNDTGYDTLPLAEFMKMHDLKEEELAVSAVTHAPNTFSLFRGDPSFRGIFGDNSDQILFTSIPKGMPNIALMVYNQDAFKMHNADWKRYNEWKLNSNKDRWVDTKSGNAIDAKNIMHLVRLIQMNREIAEGKGCIVRRPNREELLAIRNGERDLGEIIEWSQKEEKEVIKLYEQSAMRASVDMNLVKDLLLQSRKTFYGMEKTHRLNCITTYENRFLQASGGVLQ
jgi:predicted nucleotidyltransferase